MGYHRATFGIGSVTATDADGNVTDVTVVRNITVEFKSTEKPLIGNQLAPIDSATTGLEVGGTIQAADSPAALVALVVPNTAKTTGRRKPKLHEAAIPANPGPYTIQVTEHATFASNLGVVDKTSGKTLKKVAENPATGEYSVAAGTYTFAAADAGHNVAIRYSHTATDGVTRTGKNQTVGVTAGYQLEVYEPIGGTKEEGYFFPKVKFSNLSGGMKTDDWTESGFDFTAFSDGSDELFKIFSEE
jgi:hypothetical protein